MSPKAKLRKRLDAIATQRAKLQADLEGSCEQLDVGAETLEQATELLADPQGLYQRFPAKADGCFNQALFEAIYIDDGEVVDDKLPRALQRPRRRPA